MILLKIDCPITAITVTELITYLIIFCDNYSSANRWWRYNVFRLYICPSVNKVVWCEGFQWNLPHSSCEWEKMKKWSKSKVKVVATPLMVSLWLWYWGTLIKLATNIHHAIWQRHAFRWCGIRYQL